MILSNKQITKALIRLRKCAGWSAPLLFANLRRQVFSRPGPSIYSRYFNRSWEQSYIACLSVTTSKAAFEVVKWIFFRILRFLRISIAHCHFHHILINMTNIQSKETYAGKYFILTLNAPIAT